MGIFFGKMTSVWNWRDSYYFISGHCSSLFQCFPVSVTLCYITINQNSRKNWNNWNMVLKWVNHLITLFNTSFKSINAKTRTTVTKRPGEINPFQISIPFLHPLKTSENLSFSDVFWGYKMKHWPEMS